MLGNDALSSLILTGDLILTKKIRPSPVYIACEGTCETYKLLTSFFKNVKEVRFRVASSPREQISIVSSLPKTVESLTFTNRAGFGSDIIELLGATLKFSDNVTDLFILDMAVHPEEVVELIPKSVTNLSMCLGDMGNRPSRDEDLPAVVKSIPNGVKKLAILSSFTGCGMFCDFASNLHDVESLEFGYYGFNLDEFCAKALPNSLASLTVKVTNNHFRIGDDFVSNLPKNLRRITFCGGAPSSFVGLPTNIETVVIKFPGSKYRIKAKKFPSTVKHVEIHAVCGDIEVKELALQLETFYHVVPSWMGNTGQSSTGQFLREKRRLANL